MVLITSFLKLCTIKVVKRKRKEEKREGRGVERQNIEESLRMTWIIDEINQGMMKKRERKK